MLKAATLTLCLLIASPSLAGAADPCADPDLRVPVRFTQFCLVNVYASGNTCRSPVSDFVIDALLARINRYLPVCLSRSGPIKYDLSRPGQTAAWEARKNTLAAISDKSIRPAPAWDVMDVFVVEAFANHGEPTDTLGEVAHVAYALRNNRRKSKDMDLRAPLCRDEDGVVLSRSRISGPSHPSVSGDQTIAHEIGHWLGLLHTHSGCDEDDFGDDIASTTAESSRDLQERRGLKSLGACDAYPLLIKMTPLNRNSCNQKFDPDGPRNLMTYDSCRERFHDDQRAVMLEAWARRRSLQASSEVCAKP